jgi:hypothetical protein
MDKYKLIFRGQLKEGKDKAAIGKFLCKFLGIAETNADKLFSGRAYALKSNLPQQQAYDLQGKLDQAGILTDVIREKPLQDEVTYQERVVQTAQGHERIAEPDYRMKVGDKTLCRHCGSHLSETTAMVHTDTPGIVVTSQLSLLPEQPKPQVEKEISTAEVDALNVSDWWKERFTLLHKSGASQMNTIDYLYGKNGLGKLSSDARLKLMPYFAIATACLIGPLVYFFKKMYRKGCALLVVDMCCFLILEMGSYELDIELHYIAYHIVGVALVCQFYVLDYYKYRIKAETFWPELPKWMGSSVVIALGLFITFAIYGFWLNY